MDEYMRKSCLYAICSQSITNNLCNNTNKINFNFVFEVNKFVSANFNLDITRKDIAKQLNYEEHYFSTLFSQNFRMNFKKYLSLYRIAYAEKLLATTGLTVTEISARSGFKSIRSFNEIFKQQRRSLRRRL